IDVSGLGFRGGSRSSNGVTGTNVIRSTSVQKLGQMGEGISNVQWWGRGAPANGGGGSCGANSGGGGGANYGAGGNGGYTTMLEDWGGLSSHALGSYYGSSSLYRLFLGGGGGGGQQNNSYGTDGGNGGGIILIKGASFKNTNSAYAVRANGENAANATHSGNISDGAGGGGAGGCVSVTVDHLYSIHVEANGGKGGDAGEYTNDTSHGPGGGGGAGTYCLNFGSYDSYSTTSNGGGSGLSYFTGANGTPVGTGYHASNGAGGANMAYCGARQADTPADVVVACGDQTLVCEAGCAQLCVTNPQTTGTYSWSPTTGLNNPNISNPTACISTTTTYTVTYTNANGCVSTDQVTVSMPDKTLIITGDSHLCGGRYSATLCVEESTASWYKDGQPYTPPGGFANPQCITVTEPGTYYAITGLNVFPPNIKKYCAFAADDDCSCSQFQDLLPTLAGSNKVQDPCQSPVLGVPAVPGVSYSWTPTSGLSDPNIAQPTATPNTDRTYTLCASVNITGCQFTSCSSVFVDYRPYCSGGGGIPGKTDATGSMETGILLKVHPNPSRDMFNLELTGDDQMVQVDVLDLTGRTVLQVHPEQQKSTVDLTGMKQGIYMVKVRTLSGEEFVQRLMLAR
ncbi:MAG: T9SS type A sorting domain-containing protein, partial [Chitinophagales bacterium]|nr:T9SS type A sorting domain-containing protein [Chitinophagales bacterium]